MDPNKTTQISSTTDVDVTAQDSLDGFDEDVLEEGIIETEDDKVKPMDATKENIVNEVPANTDFGYLSTRSWEDLKIRDEIYQNLINMGFVTPSKIQASTFDLIVTSPYKHLIAQAPNGCGKTGAFTIPTIHRVNENESTIQAVIFAHNKIMVDQISQIAQKMIVGTKIVVTALKDNNKASISTCGQIVVTTPGNFEKVIKKRLIADYSTIKMLVLDEADDMINNDSSVAGFKAFLEVIVSNKVDCQFIFFSATFETRHFNFINKYVKKAHLLQVDREALTLKNVKQMYYLCKSGNEKIEFLANYLKVSFANERCLIFVNTKDYLKQLHQSLNDKGYKTYVLMGGDMDKENRELTVKKFKDGDIQILITTDIIARGFDEKLVKLVINFDIPTVYKTHDPAYDTYLHRIGRTGRFGTSGIGLNLLRQVDRAGGTDELAMIQKIQDFYKSEITEIKSTDELIVEFKKILDNKF